MIMRLVNPAWEAVKEFVHASRFRDVLFDLDGRELQADHGYLLRTELLARLPWLADCEGAGIHPVHGEPTDHDTLIISRRARLWLRLPLERADAAGALCGQTLDLGCGMIRIARMQVRPLAPFAYQYSHFVDMGTADEALFMTEAQRQLDELEIRCGLIPGKARKMQTPEQEIRGYSLMLHDLSLLDSIRLQERGIGASRLLGCGLFIPHKSIKEVVVE